MLRLFSFLFTALFLVPSFGQSFFGGGSYSKRGNKENVRWTLGDWLTQKKQFRLMDQWLALNTQANFFEINASGGQSSYDLTIGGSVTEQTVDTYSLQMWISIFGIQYTKDKSDENWESESGQLNVRLFGQSSQSTSLTGFYGQRSWKDLSANNSYKNQYAGANLNLYIVSFLGVEAAYRKDFKATDTLNREIEGERLSYGAFIELSFMRLYGNAFVDKSSVSQGGSVEEQERDGVDAGIRFFF